MRQPRPAVFVIGRRGVALGQRLQAPLDADLLLSARVAPLAGRPPAFDGADGLKQVLATAFNAGRPLVLVMPVGAAVRLVAPLLRSKHHDPAVVVVDEAGSFAVPLAGSHEAGANALAQQVAAVLHATPVVTTTAEATGTLALDVLAQQQHWRADGGDLTGVTARLVDGEPVGVFQDAGDESWWAKAPETLERFDRSDALGVAPVAARIYVTDHVIPPPPAGVPAVVYRPHSLAVGVGCVRGASASEIVALIAQSLAAAGLSRMAIATLATIDVKQTETGITQAAAQLGVPVAYFPATDLTAAPRASEPSQYVLNAVGAPGVCEPAAVLAAGGGTLLVAKQKTPRVTVAVARVITAPHGSLALVGIGPGAAEGATAAARQALQAADTIVGYSLYVEQVQPWLSGEKHYLPRPIGEEIERCREAIALARQGHKVALVCSGDAGIYGMAGLVLELYAEQGDAAAADALQVVPGVTAGQSAAALLGAPLMSDYMTVSLSDLMTPWPVIRRRVEAAAEGDLVLVLYNPQSARRRRLPEVAEVLLAHRSPETPVGIVRNAGRPTQAVTIAKLGSLLDEPVDMLTTVVIGNSSTERLGGRMFTRRGYAGKWASEATDTAPAATAAIPAIHRPALPIPAPSTGEG